MMFDDDDGVEPQFRVVDEYYFEHSEVEPVCFSILPLHFDNNEEVVNCDSDKKVYLRGVLDKSLHLVHKRVVAWRVELDCEQLKILVLSGEGNWITILRPRKCYKEKIARSILITVQMLHFIKKQSGDKLLGRLWDHLYKVFNKLKSKPTVDDLRKHHPLIKLFVERDPSLIKSQILRSLIEDTKGEMKEPKTLSTKAQFIVSVESHSSSEDDDDKNDCDYSYNEHDSDEESSYIESSTEDDYNYSESNCNGDYTSDGDTDTDDSDNDDCTDVVCAICDDGGKLLSCIGHCKRSFHPRVKDGRESKCKTLGYSSAQLKGISDFLCQNCKYKQHQCFKCGELEPSDGLNAKVFKCNNASCGHFYHPKCVAKLLEPDDGACELAKRIISGMSFTCPVHWCFECGKMEDRTHRALQFAVCRRCPKSYHRECLPRNISFESKGKDVKRAWDLSDNILIYCRDHRLYRTTGTAGRNHIKFPCISEEISKTNYPVKKKVKTNGNRKMGIHQRPIESTELLNRSCTDEMEQDPKLTVTNPEHAAKCLKEDLQCEPSVVGPDASPGSLDIVKGHEKHFGTPSFAKGPGIIKNASCALGRQLKNRVMSKSDKETSSGISHGNSRKRVMPSYLGICGRTDQDIVSGNSLVEKDGEWVRITGNKGDGERVITSDCYAGEENGTPDKDSHSNREHNGVLDNSLEKHSEAEAIELKSGKEGAIERGGNAFEHGSLSGQEQVISTCEQDSGSRRGRVTSAGSNKCDSESDKVTPDHIDGHHPQKPLSIAHVDKATIMNITDTKPGNKCGEDREVNGSYSCQVDRNNSQSNKSHKTIDTAGGQLINSRETKEKATGGKKADMNRNKKCNHIKNGSKDPCEDMVPVHAEAHTKIKSLANHKELDVLDCRLKGSGLNSRWHSDGNVAKDISKCKSKRRAVPNRRDEMRDIRANSSYSYGDRNAQKRLRCYSQEEEMGHRDSYPGTSNRFRYEQKRHDDYSCYDYDDWRQWSPRGYSPDFGSGRSRSPPYLGRQEYGTARRCGRRGPEYVPSGRRSSPSRPRMMEDINYATHWDSFHDPEYDEYKRSRSHVCPPYTRRPEHGRRHTPPFHLRRPDIHPHCRVAEHGTSRRYSPLHRPRRSEHVDYTQDWSSPPRMHYDQYDEYGGYEMDIDPVARYSLGDKNYGAYRPGMDVNVEERAAPYVGPVNDYDEGSWTPKASGLVTDNNVPRLDQTNHHPIDRNSLHYAPLPVRWR